MRGEVKGAVSVLLSAFLFYLATFFVKLGSPQKPLDSIIYLAARFWLGYAFFLVWFPTVKKTGIKQLKTINRKWLWLRAFWNLVAVMFFYLSVIFGSLTSANILNMTYPIFVALLSIYFLAERPDFMTWVSVLLSVAGAFFVLLSAEDLSIVSSLLLPKSGSRLAEIFGILSAITAALAVVALRVIRLTDSTEAALFYNFRLGFWVTLLPVIYYVVANGIHDSNIILYPLLSGVSGILGQVAMTWGFKYVTAVFGSILSSTRLIFAVLIGWIFFQTEVNLYSVTGALFIFFANIALVAGKKK